MKLIGDHQGRKVYWFDYGKFELNQLPNKDWLCLASSDIFPNREKFEEFVRSSIRKNILEFKGQGKFGEKLHDLFDETMVEFEITENILPFDIGTTAHKEESFASAFWDCFFATTLPLSSDLNNISIVCTDLSGSDKSNFLKTILQEFNEGWSPEN